MDARTGEIRNLTREDLQIIERGYLADCDKEQRRAEELKHMVMLTDEQHAAIEPMAPPQRKNWMRNQQCPCNSGKKFKKCCWSKHA